MNKFFKVMACIMLAMEVLYAIAEIMLGYQNYGEFILYDGWGRSIIQILFYISIITSFKKGK